MGKGHPSRNLTIHFLALENPARTLRPLPAASQSDSPVGVEVSLSRLSQPIKARSLCRRDCDWICVAARRIAPSAGSEALAHLEDEAGCGGWPRKDGG